MLEVEARGGGEEGGDLREGCVPKIDGVRNTRGFKSKQLERERKRKSKRKRELKMIQG